MKKTRLLKLSFILISLFGLSSPASASCSVHDHNCLHGVYPLDPALGNIPTGAATLQVITNYGGAPDVDLNQHVRLPAGSGPFVASNPDGNPLEATPLGGGPDVIFHNQQTVQFVNATSGGQLSSTPGTEQTDFIGNVAQGSYGVAVYNYDLGELGLSGSFSTSAIAGGTGHFSAPTQSHAGGAFVQNLNVLGGALAPDQATSASFTYYNNGFSPHAQGIYLIPGGTWNLGGVSADGQVSQFATLDHSAGFITAGGRVYQSNPYDLQTLEIYGYGNYLVDPKTGLVLNTSTYQQTADCGGDRDCVRTVSIASGVVTDPFTLQMLGTAAAIPGQIQESYGDAGKAHAWDYYHGKYDQARALLNCPECSELQLIELSKGKNAGLTPDQQLEFQTLITQAYGGQKYYDKLKSDKNRGLIKLGAYLIAAAVIGDIATAAAEFSALGAASAEVAYYSVEIGAFAGGAAAAFTGTYLATGDFDAALLGGATGALFSGLDSLQLNGWLDTGSKAVVGGLSSKAGGGEFKDGFELVAVTTGAQNLYEYLVGYGIDPGPGENEAKPKNNDTLPYPNTNNVGCISSSPCSPFGVSLTEGSPGSKFLNGIPMVNAYAGLHDVAQANFTGVIRNIVNLPAIPPAVAITTLGALAPSAPILINSSQTD